MTNTAAPRRPTAQAASLVTPTETVKEFNSGTEYAADKAKSGIHEARSTVKNAANNARNGAENAVETVKQTYRDSKGAAQQNWGDIERQIREKPVQATLIAAGLGFLVATLLTRWRNNALQSKIPSSVDVGRRIEDAVRAYGPALVTAGVVASGFVGRLIAKRFRHIWCYFGSEKNLGFGGTWLLSAAAITGAAPWRGPEIVVQFGRAGCHTIAAYGIDRSASLRRRIDIAVNFWNGR
jgi:ElaB/YqjD/DUF883 family membrane-anchored ribosome-binding protein